MTPTKQYIPTTNNSVGQFNISNSINSKFNFAKGGPEVILLCGPSDSGKSDYYRQNFKESHKRISAIELFHENPNLSIRQLIQQYLISQLKEGVSVVVDDTNHLSTIRDTYIQSIIKSSVPISRMALLNFRPSGGELQLHWKETWNLCEQSIINGVNNSNSPNSNNNSNKLDLNTYKLEYKEPHKSEGYCNLSEITTPLTLNVFENNNNNNGDMSDVDIILKNKGLFIDARSIIKFIKNKDGHELRYKVILDDQVEKPIIEWMYAGINRRVIVFIDETSLFPSCLDLDSEIQYQDTYRKEIKNRIRDLMNLIGFPIYYFNCPKQVQEEHDFFRLPNLGLFAWAQYRHRLSLPSSIFIIDDSDVKFITSIPFNVCLASKFFQINTNWKAENKIMNNLIENITNIPSFLENINIVYRNPNEDDAIHCNIEKGFALSEAYKREVEKSEFVEEFLPQNKQHGVFFPISSYQVQSLSQQNQISDSLLEDIEFDECQDDIQPQQQSNIPTITTTSTTTTSTTTTTTTVRTQNSPPITIDSSGQGLELVFITQETMKEWGIDDLSIMRGYGYFKENRLFDMEVSIFQSDTTSPSLKMFSKCTGTSKEPYSVSVRYRFIKPSTILPQTDTNDNNDTTATMKTTVLPLSPILETSCTCPNGVRTYGKCKHVVTLIYHCNLNYAKEPPKVQKISPNKQPSTPVKSPQRKLPKWMSDPVPDKDKSPNKRTLNLYFPENQKQQQQQQQQNNLQRRGKPELKFAPLTNNNSNNNNNNGNMPISPVKKQKSFQPQPQYVSNSNDKTSPDKPFSFEIDEEDLIEMQRVQEKARNDEFIKSLFTNKPKPIRMKFDDNDDEGDDEKDKDEDNSFVPRTNSENQILNILKIDQKKIRDTVFNYEPPSPSSTQYLAQLEFSLPNNLDEYFDKTESEDD